MAKVNITRPNFVVQQTVKKITDPESGSNPLSHDPLKPKSPIGRITDPEIDTLFLDPFLALLTAASVGVLFHRGEASTDIPDGNRSHSSPEYASIASDIPRSNRPNSSTRLALEDGCFFRRTAKNADRKDRCAGFPSSLPLAVSPGLCKNTPCAPGSYEVSSENAPCKSRNFHIYMPCSTDCPTDMYQKSGCTLNFDRLCDYNCSRCNSVECFSNCSSNSYSTIGNRNERFWSLQLPIIVAEIVFAVLLLIIVSLTAVLYVPYRLQSCRCRSKESKSMQANEIASYRKENVKVRPEFDELNRSHLNLNVMNNNWECLEKHEWEDLN